MNNKKKTNRKEQFLLITPDSLFQSRLAIEKVNELYQIFDFHGN